jgi:hypothetical protein
MMEETERKRLDARLSELKTLRSKMESEWKSVCDNTLPWRQLWQYSDKDKGVPSNRQTVLNTTPVRSVSRFASGMMAGITSPARRWFHLSPRRPELQSNKEVQTYCEDCEETLWAYLSKSNLYVELSSGKYFDLGMIGNAATVMDEDPKETFRFTSLAIGAFWIDHDNNKRVDTLFREIPMSVRQMVQEFGYDKCSQKIKNAWDKNEHATVFCVVHAIYPNSEWKVGKLGPQGMKWASRWWEANTSEDQSFLRTGGYEEFPVLVARWNVRPGDVYGRGPGNECLGPCKALQHFEIQKAKLADKTADPPMKGSGILGRMSLIAGECTYFNHGQGGSFEPAQTIDPRAQAENRLNIAEQARMIEEAFYVDLWMALLNDQRAQRPTATEVEATKQEVMLQLGPLLQNLNHDLLEPLVYRAMAILNRQGKLPPPPQALVEAQLSDPTGEDNPIEVEFISILHQAQKMTGIVGMRELIAAVQQLVSIGKTAALDKLNEDAVLDELSGMLGVHPSLIYSSEQVAKTRAAREQQQAAQAQGQAMLSATQGARNLSSVEPQKLTELAGMLTPAAAAQGGLVGGA